MLRLLRRLRDYCCCCWWMLIPLWRLLLPPKLEEIERRWTLFAIFYSIVGVVVGAGGGEKEGEAWQC
uniref:Uncharacterized protein n=1 Tax=Populus trichocarpa TaxID=3694 RepID=A0A2K2C004_POPTR